MTAAERWVGVGGRTTVAGWRAWLARPRTKLLAATALGAIGVGASWNWLAAIGALPVILSALPCLAMCALGLCMRGLDRKSCSTQVTASAPLTAAETPAARSALPDLDPVSPTSDKEDSHA